MDKGLKPANLQSGTGESGRYPTWSYRIAVVIIYLDTSALVKQYIKGLSLMIILVCLPTGLP